MTTQQKAKRKLTNFDFSEEGSHLALVHKDQGGGANGYKTLVTKATAKYSPEFIQKAQRIKVEMELPEFLMRFYDMWWEEDAKELAKLFGWVDYSEMIDGLEETLEGETKVEVLETTPTDYVRGKLQNADRVAELSNTQDLASALAALTEVQYLMLLEDQQEVEKALRGGQKPKVESKKKTPTPVNKKADKAVHKKENDMSGDNTAMIEKAQYDAIQKALDEQKEQLEKATKALAEFEAKEKEAIAKARKADILAAVEAEDAAEKLFKAVGELAPEAFNDVVEVLKGLNVKVEKSLLFTEQGSKAEGEKVAKSALRAAIENKHNKQ